MIMDKLRVGCSDCEDYIVLFSDNHEEIYMREVYDDDTYMGCLSFDKDGVDEIIEWLQAWKASRQEDVSKSRENTK